MYDFNSKKHIYIILEIFFKVFILTGNKELQVLKNKTGSNVRKKKGEK